MDVTEKQISQPSNESKSSTVSLPSPSSLSRHHQPFATFLHYHECCWLHGVPCQTCTHMVWSMFVPWNGFKLCLSRKLAHIESGIVEFGRGSCMVICGSHLFLFESQHCVFPSTYLTTCWLPWSPAEQWSNLQFPEGLYCAQLFHQLIPSVASLQQLDQVLLTLVPSRLWTFFFSISSNTVCTCLRKSIFSTQSCILFQSIPNCLLVA